MVIVTLFIFATNKNIMGPPTGINYSQWIKFNFHFFAEHFLGLKNFNKLLGNSRKALYQEIDQNLKSSDRGELLDMPQEVATISFNEFQKKYVDNFLPVVFRKAAVDWPCVKNWSFDFFKKNYGDREVSLLDNVGLVDRKNPQKFENLSFASFIDELSTGSLKYLKFSRIMDEDSTLKNDFDVNWLRKFRPRGSIGDNFLMFMGGDTSITPMHSGFGNTLFVQVTGKKKWIFWKPNERIFFDPRAGRNNYNYTDADPYNLDDPKFPLLKYAKRYEVTLEPGDVLWFPTHLWHQVESQAGGISVAYKFSNISHSFRSSTILTFLFFFATNPTIFTDLFYYLTAKKDYMYTNQTRN